MTHYTVKYDEHRRAPHLVNAYEVSMVLWADGDKYIQYAGGYVAGSDLLILRDEPTDRFWSAVAVGIARMLGDEVQRGVADLGDTMDERATMLCYPVDVMAADKLARSDADLPDVREHEVVLYEFDVVEEGATRTSSGPPPARPR